MTSLTAVAVPDSTPRVRWTWLWSSREDVTWNLLPFWLSLVLGVFLLSWWQIAAWAHWPVKFPEAATQARITGLVMYLYGPLIDAPHLWATIARTYTDAGEWVERRRLFIGSLLWFVIGPAAILLPYALRTISLYPAGYENVGWVVWSHFFTFYALYHINKQHWGFVALYRRKNGEATSEYQIDRAFFTMAIWLPYVAWLTAPWYLDFDGAPLPLTRIVVGWTTLGHAAHVACHVLFLVVCLAYAGFQAREWRRGSARNGPKLVYLATVIPIYYLAFALNPLLAAFWVLMTGVGHCAQYPQDCVGLRHEEVSGAARGRHRELAGAHLQQRVAVCRARRGLRSGHVARSWWRRGQDMDCERHAGHNGRARAVRGSPGVVRRRPQGRRGLH